jgi:hypothetical protein
MNNRPDTTACCIDIERGVSAQRENLKSHGTDNVRPRSSFRRASSERRNSLDGISWNRDLEAVCIIPARGARVQQLEPLMKPLYLPSQSPCDVTAKVFIIPAPPEKVDSFMALVQTPPPLRPSSSSPFDVTATAAGAAAASRAGVALAMANSVKHRNRNRGVAHDRGAYSHLCVCDICLFIGTPESVFEDDACSWLSVPSTKSKLLRP